MEDISKTYVGGMIDDMHNRVNEVNKYINFDIRNIQPSFHTILNVSKGTVLQCYAINEHNDEIYTSQLIGTIPQGVAETYTLSRLDKFGKLLDSMDIRYGGHGTSFGLEIENGQVYIWSNYHQTDDSGIKIKDELVRFHYEPNKEIFFDDPTVEIHNKFNDVYTIPTVDNKNGLIALRYTNSEGKQIVELRRIADIKNNVDIVLGKVAIPNELSYLQGITIDGYNLYWRIGDTNAVLYKDEIVQFDFKTGKEVCRIECEFGKGHNNEYEDNFREPEGIYLYTDMLTGKKTLFASVVTGSTARRLNKSYAFHQLGNGEKFNGDILTTVQKYELTKSNGYAKRIPYGTTNLSTILEPGTYYMTSANSLEYEDHPNPNAGYWMEVLAPNTDGGVMQILRRNTGVGNNETYIRRVLKNGTVNEWDMIDSWRCKYIPKSITDLKQFRQKGTYYMTSADSGRYEDHPMPNIAGWFLEVSPLDHSENHFCQILRRNTADNKNMLVFYRQVQRDSNKVLKATDWMTTFSGSAQVIPSYKTLISSITTSGQYYMTTVEANEFIDHPEPNTTAGWFLEVSESSSSGNFTQTMKKNVSTGSSMAIYYRNIMANGTFSVWKSIISSGNNDCISKREEVVLWNGSCKGDFTTNFELTESIKDFNSIYIQVESDTGKNATDRNILMSQWNTNECQFLFHNLSNTSGNLDYWLFEYAITFNAEGTTFKNTRSIRLKIAEEGTKTRTDNDKTIGISEVIGIRN